MTRSDLHSVLNMPGEPLDRMLREWLEPLFGRDLSDVRIHRDRQAACSATRIGASAYTVGSHIVFAAGKYRPETWGGRTLIAHEMAHVMQQRGCGPVLELQLGGPAELECEADTIAARVVRGGPAGRWSRVPAAGLVQMHFDLPCPGPPEWKQVTAEDRMVADAANLIIEQAYALTFGRKRVIFSSDYGEHYKEEQFTELGFRDGQIRFAQELMKQLRGIELQNRPDIIDFERRCFYEIKTEFTARKRKKEVEDQLLDLYRKANSIARSLAGTSRESIGSWSKENATWYPRHVLPWPGDPDRIVCTCATDYGEWVRGLILYEVRERVVKRERRKARERADANDVELVDILDEVKPLWPMIKREARLKARYYDRELPHYVVLMPPKFYSQLFDQHMQSKWDLLRSKPPFLTGSNPIGFQHMVIGGVVFLAASAILTFGVASAFLNATVAAGQVIAVFNAVGETAIGTVAVDAAAVGTSATAAGAGSSAGEVVSLEAYRALRAAPVVQKLLKAAGVLLVLGAGRRADARPANGRNGNGRSPAGQSVALNHFEIGACVAPIANFRIEKGDHFAVGKADDTEAPYFYDADTVKNYFKLRNKVIFDNNEYVVVGTLWPHD